LKGMCPDFNKFLNEFLQITVSCYIVLDKQSLILTVINFRKKKGKPFILDTFSFCPY